MSMKTKDGCVLHGADLPESMQARKVAETREAQGSGREK